MDGLLNYFGSANGLAGLLSPEDLEANRRMAMLTAGLNMAAASSGTQPGVRPGLVGALAQGLQAGQQAFQSGIQNQVGNVLTAAKIAELKRQQLARQGQLEAIQSARNADGSIDYRKLAEGSLQYADNPLDVALKGAEVRTKVAEANRLDAAAQGMVSNPFEELAQSNSLHPSVQKLATQYAKSFPTLKPDVVDQRYQTLIDMSNKAFEREQSRSDTKAQRDFQNQMLQQGLDLKRMQSESQPRKFDFLQQRAIKSVDQMREDANNAEQMLSLANEAEKYLSAAPTGTVSGLVAKGANVLNIPTEQGAAQAGLSRITGALIPLAPRAPGPVSDFESRKIEQSVGALNDPATPVQAKKDAIKFLRDQAKRTIDRAAQAQQYLEGNNYSLEGFKYQPQSTGIPQVKSAADYNKLESGAVYTDPNGVQRRKP